MPRLPNRQNAHSGSEEPGALVFESSGEPKSFLAIAVVVVFLVVVGGVYGGLRWHKSQLEAQEKELNQKMDKLSKESRKPIIDEALSFKKRASKAEELLREHKHWNEVFSLLEEITLPEIQYTKFSGQVDSREIRLELITPSYKRVSQQILIYRNVDEIEDFRFEPPKKSETGVSMPVTLTLSSQVWQKNN